MKRVLLIGLDGADFDIINKMKDKLPNIRKIMKNGSFGRLRSTPLPLTGPAWVSMITGKNPGKHGIYDFMQGLDRRLMDSNDIDSETVFDILGRNGKRVVAINVPMTYPAKEINGYMITGLPYPVDTYPREIRSLLPKYYRTLPNERTINEIIRMARDNIDVTKMFIKKDWDFFMVVFGATDFVGHWFWGERKKIESVYKKADEMVGELLKYADKDTAVIIVSDHGMGKLKKYICLNTWLLKNNYLVLKNTPKTKIKYFLHRLGLTLENIKRFGAKIGVLKEGVLPGGKISFILKIFLGFSDVDFQKTRAYANNNYSPIFVRDERTKKELIKKLKDIKDSGKKVIKHVFTKEDVYKGIHMDEAPDIMFYSSDLEYSTKTYSEFASNKIFFSPDVGIRGDHRIYGILIMNKKSKIKRPCIYDIAPTVLRLLGVNAPDDMDGKSLV